ncbi:MAG: pitrilysin family protein [Acidobacteriota bacterium]|nr:insulinase family protein [Blastocatellia bacterium]MDW8413636.1 pitrilysin family protein [Acidobacteriota bacterium]
MRRYFCALILYLATAAIAQEDIKALPKRERLLNGLSVAILERPGSGTVAAHLVVRAGATFDPVSKFGISKVMAEMLLRSAGGWTLERLQEELADIDATIEVRTGWDSIELAAMTRSSLNVAGLLSILGQIVADPKFREQELETFKSEHKRILESVPPPTVLASQLLQKALFGMHPYGHTIDGELADLAALKRPDLFDHYDRIFLANNAALVVVGDVSAEKILPVIKRAFGGWKKATPAPYTFIPPTDFTGIHVKLVEKDLPQNAFCAGAFAMRRTDADYLPALLLTEVLNIKFEQAKLELKAVLHARRMRGYIEICGRSTDVVSDLATFLKLRQLETVSEQEVMAARARVKDSYYAPLRTAQAELNSVLAEKLAELESYNYGASYLNGFAADVDKVTLQQIRLAAQYLQNLKVVAVGRVGDKAAYEALGKVE